MNNLYTFGCSFTENFSFFHNKKDDNSRKKYVTEFCNNTSPESWNESLSKKIGFNLKNYGGTLGVKSYNGDEGNCNDSIFNNICHLSCEFKKGDILIVEWTYMERFKWAMDNNNSMITLLPSNYKFVGNDNVIEGVLINRTSKLWIGELFKKIKIINTLSESIGFDVFYWTIDKRIINYKMMMDIYLDKKWLLNDKFSYDKIDYGYKDVVFELGGKTITEESNNLIIDDHFGKTAHDVLSELFYDDIIKKIK
jgi:hypothetical protein